MTTHKILTTSALGLAFALACFAAQWDKRTIVTWTEPTLVGSVTLPAGKYVLRLEDVPSSRHVVRFLNEREDRVLATVLALPNLRLRPTNKTEFSWWETPRGNPPALRAWFYPGDSFGHEFVYPKGLATRIAKETGGPVLTAPSTAAAELSTTPVTETLKTGEETPLEEFFVTKAAPAPEAPVEVARAEPAPAPAQQEAVPSTRSLPATASPYFTLGAAGLFLIVVGFALRKVSAFF